MMDSKRLRWVLLAALALGALAGLLLGDGPRSAALPSSSTDDWQPPRYSAPDVASAQSLWTQRNPWGQASAAEAAQQAATVFEPKPVGVIAVAGRYHALFSQPDQQVVRLAQGDAIPGAGRVLAISATVVRWQDAAGGEHRHHLLDPDAAHLTPPDPTPPTQP